MDGLTPWLILAAVGLLLAGGIVAMEWFDRRRFNRLLVESVDEATEQMGQEMAPPPEALAVALAAVSPQVAAFNPAVLVDPNVDLHEKYAPLAETDPRLAGRLKYLDQLARHGA